MKFNQSFSILFRKYSLFRAILLIIAVVLGVIGISIASKKSKKIPAISSLNPSVGTPGDTMTIRGSNFGEVRGAGFVEIGGSRITASNYVTWSDNFIQLIIPSNIQDGLVVVSTSAGRSKPDFFANETNIPIEVTQTVSKLMPVIINTSSNGTGIGSVVTITGENFGAIRGNSEIFFTANRDDANFSNQNQNLPGNLETKYINANEENFDYVSWNDSEIKVRIPEGAATGNFFIQTEKGKSNFGKITLNLPGTKNYTDRKTYLIQINADVDSVDTKNKTAIRLHLPRPLETATQPMAEMTDFSPEPLMENFKNTVIHHLDLPRATSQSKKFRFNHDFVVSVYSLKTTVNPKSVKNLSERNRLIYKDFISEDTVIKSDDEKIISLAKQIVGKEINPYNQAKLVYNYMIDNYTLLLSLKKADSSPYNLIEEKRGDSYDFSVVYTALLRALKIPSVTDSGILVDSKLTSQTHWWNEFYIENMGWIPVDISLGAGMNYDSFKDIENGRDFYFGNLDSQHIAFSRGWNELKRTLAQDSVIVYRPKTFSMQSIWEESLANNVSYSSFWNDPIVNGVY